MMNTEPQSGEQIEEVPAEKPAQDKPQEPISTEPENAPHVKYDTCMP